ncbi:MAG: hypothetical protein G8D89_16430 [gamma proteobacterium symbiont of Clathrolucina costata]
MDKSEQKALYRWLDTATDQELQQKLLDLESISLRLTEPDVIREFHWIKSKVLEEIDVRKRCKAAKSEVIPASVPLVDHLLDKSE